MNTDLDEKVIDAITQQAAQWCLMHRGGAMKDSAREHFIEWLRRSPTHVGAYLAVASAEKDLQEAARAWPTDADSLVAEATEKENSVTNVVPLLEASSGRASVARSSQRRRVFAAMAAAMALVAVAGGLLLRDGQRFGIPRAYETAHAEQGSFPLPDGSVLHLNSDSRAVVRFGGSERLVTVEHGQAMFQVAKDPQRRFRVDAGSVQVIAIGTEFDVYRRTSDTRVVVLEGRVAVLRDGLVPGPATLDVAGATALSAGEQIEVGPARVAAAQPADMRRARAWLQREIVFDELSLAQVVEDFNRYSSIPLQVDGDELRALQISGVFGAYDVESFLAFLRRLDGVGVEEGRSRIRIYLLRTASQAPISVMNETGHSTQRWRPEA